MKKPANLRLKETVTTKRTKSVPEDYLTRKKKYEELKELRQMIKKKKEKTAAQLKAEQQRLEEKRKRKEINIIKSGKYDVIKNPTKIKKWKRKARKLLQKLPPEIFYEQNK